MLFILLWLSPFKTPLIRYLPEILEFKAESFADLLNITVFQLIMPYKYLEVGLRQKAV